jgi:peptidoglycan hydrolase CwlO-like protein
LELKLATKKAVAKEKLMDDPQKTESDFTQMNEYLDYVAARMKYLDNQVRALKLENDQHKATIRRMERRILDA